MFLYQVCENIAKGENLLLKVKSPDFIPLKLEQGYDRSLYGFYKKVVYVDYYKLYDKIVDYVCDNMEILMKDNIALSVRLDNGIVHIDIEQYLNI